MVKIMLDSGAFSVWNSGKTINLDDYIAFCRKCKKVAYFVNLDVIPSDKVNQDQAAEQSWNNYRIMLKRLPKEKIIPVFHSGEDVKWLKKYLDFGCNYIGLGSGNISITAGDKKKRWVNSLRKILLNDGKPIAKVHGFAMASHELMACFPWHSVDSTTWAQHAQVWHVLMPKRASGNYDYTREPIVIELSPRSKKSRQGHIDSLSPLVKECVLKYLQENKLKLGSYELCEVNKGYKRQNGEYWLDSKKQQVVRTIEEGVKSKVECRMLLNARLYAKSAEALNVPCFYFSGVNDKQPWTDELSCILLSFHKIARGFETCL